MAWLMVPGNERRVLCLEIEGRFVPYWKTPMKVPDHNIPGGSKGWATYQKMLKAGWTVVSEETALGRKQEEV